MWPPGKWFETRAGNDPSRSLKFHNHGEGPLAFSWLKALSHSKFHPPLFRMQTTGEPMKIQITYETKMLLDNLGGYTSEVRGQVEVKGKGLMDTYWLLGKV